MHGSPKCGVWGGRRRSAVAWAAVAAAALAGAGVVQAQQMEPLVEIPVTQPPPAPAAPTPPEEATTATQQPAAEVTPSSAPVADPAPAAAPTSVVVGSRTDFVVRMNQAIALFIRGQAEAESRAEAARMFQALLAHSPDNKTCLYHLGLIAIRDGIEFSRGAADATEAARAEPEAAARAEKFAAAVVLDRKAKDAFDAAREHFKKLVDIDVALRATEGGLYLGIAQLAIDEGADATVADERERLKRHINSPAFLENSQLAESVLTPYVDSEAGKADPYGRFFLGIARFRLGLRDDMSGRGYYEKAMEDFEASKALAVSAAEKVTEYEVELSEFNPTVDYYEGLIYALRNDREEATRIFERLSADPKAENLQKNAKAILDALEHQSGSTPGPSISTPTPLGALSFEGNIAMGNFYDTNVILLGKHQALPYGIPKKDDYRFGLDAGFDVTLYADENTFKKNNWFGKSLFLGIGGQTSNLWQPSIGEYQVNAYGGRAYVNYEPVDNIYFGLRYDYAWAMLGQEPFFGSNRVIPSASYSWRKGFDRRNEEITRTDFFYVNDYREYHDLIPDERFDRTGEYQAFGVTQTFNILKAQDMWKKYYESRDPNSVELLDRDRWSRVWVGYTYRDEQTKGTEFDVVGDSLVFGFEIPLPKRFAFDFRAGITWDDYDNNSALDYRGNARHDMIQDYQFGLSYIMIAKGQYKPMDSLEMKLRGTIQTIMDDSNVWNRLGEEAYSYNRNLYGLQLLINF